MTVVKKESPGVMASRAIEEFDVVYTRMVDSCDYEDDKSLEFLTIFGRAMSAEVDRLNSVVYATRGILATLKAFELERNHHIGGQENMQ